MVVVELVRTDGLWRSGDIRIRVAPDLLLGIGGNAPIQTLLHLNKRFPVDQRAANPVLAMMKDALSTEFGVAVLDVHRGKLFTPTNTSTDHLIGAHADAAAFALIWKQLSV